MQSVDTPSSAPDAHSPPAGLFGPSGFFGALPNPQGQPAGELLRHALHVIRTHFGMQFAFVAEFHQDRHVFRYLDADPQAGGMLEGPPASSLADAYCQGMVAGRLPGAIRNTGECTEFQRLPGADAVPIRSCIGAPVRFGNGAVYGTFCCFGLQPDPTLNERDAETMRLFANFVAGVLEHQTLEDANREKLAARVERVLQQQEFTILYQPIVSVARSRLVGYEALTRLQGEAPSGPEVFFKEAAAAGLLERLEAATMRRALEGLCRIPKDVYLSINVSPSTILSEGLEPVLHGQPLRRLVLEVTEHASISDYAAVERQLEPWRRRGLRLAVDDAGAGFASFRHILKMRPDDIKLDISLIRKIDRDLSARALAAALIRFARETGSKIVAEGVESESVLDVLRELRVDKAQGFLLGRAAPLPPLPVRAHRARPVTPHC